MGIEDDFYATIKLKSGEEVFAKVAASEEEDRTMLIIHSPVTVAEIKNKGGLVGYKVEPWLKTTREDMFIVNMDNVITMSGIRYHGKITKATREHDNLHVVGYKSSSGVTHIPFLILLFDLSRTVLLTRG